MVSSRRLFFGLICAISVLGVGTSEVAAISLAPTNWISTITSTTPTNPAVSVEVVNGGDALRLTTQAGHVVVIPGYRNEPYLRIDSNGEVEANLRSPTWWANQTGSGTSDIPATADPDAVPEWSVISRNGSVVWHDHRVHAMPGVTADTDWTVLVTVDDLPLVVRGRLAKLPSASPLPVLLLGVLTAGLVVLLGVRKAWLTTVIALILASVLSFIVAIGAWTFTPPDVDLPVLPMIAAVVSTALSMCGVFTSRSSRGLRVVCVIGALATFAWWVALMAPALTAAFIPNAVPELFVRSALGVVAGIVVGGAVIVAITGGYSDADPVRHADAADGVGVVV